MTERSAEDPQQPRSRAAPEAGPGGNGGGGGNGALPAHDVLVVEDDPDINQLVGAYAQLAGFTYRAAHTGGAALAEVDRRKPTVIVLDLMLPDLDGLEVCRRVKSGGRNADVPVIILTALESDASRRRGAEVGAAEYLTKPFDPDTLMRVITRYATDVRGSA